MLIEHFPPSILLVSQIYLKNVKKLNMNINNINNIPLLKSGKISKQNESDFIYLFV